jgi:hypothetical protein
MEKYLHDLVNFACVGMFDKQISCNWIRACFMLETYRMGGVRKTRIGKLYHATYLLSCNDVLVIANAAYFSCKFIE